MGDRARVVFDVYERATGIRFGPFATYESALATAKREAHGFAWAETMQLIARLEEPERSRR